MPHWPAQPRSSPNAGLAQWRAPSPICIGNVGATWLRRAGSRAAAFGARAHCRLTPTPVTAPARLLCSATGSAAGLKVGRQPPASGRTSALRGSDSPGRSCPSSSARAVSLVTTVFPAKRRSLVERPWSASANASPADPTVALSPRPSPAAGRGSRSAVIVVAWGGGFAAPTLNRVTVTRSVLVAGSMASPAVARRTACAWVCSPG